MPNGFEYTAVITAFLAETQLNDAVMTGLVGTKVHDTHIPQAATEAERMANYPCSYFTPVAFGRVLLGNGDTIVWAPTEWALVGMDIGESWYRLEPIAARLLQLFHGNTGVNVTTGGYINTCTYRRPERASQEVGGIIYQRLGGIFEIRARLSPS